MVYVFCHPASRCFRELVPFWPTSPTPREPCIERDPDHPTTLRVLPPEASLPFGAVFGDPAPIRFGERAPKSGGVEVLAASTWNQGSSHGDSRTPAAAQSAGQAALVVTAKSSNQAVSAGWAAQTPVALPMRLSSTVTVWPAMVGSRQICARV